MRMVRVDVKSDFTTVRIDTTILQRHVDAPYCGRMWNCSRCQGDCQRSSGSCILCVMETGVIELEVEGYLIRHHRTSVRKSEPEPLVL